MTADQAPRSESSSWPRRLFPIAGLLLLAAAFVIPHVRAYGPLSPFDEGVHFDYVDKVLDGELVMKGDRLGELAMRETACRGIDFEGIVLPPCQQREPFVPEQFPNLGYNSADIHPPLYYAIAGVVGRALTAVGIAPTLLDGVRLGGILWLTLGLVTVWALGKELDIEKKKMALILILLASSPPLLHASATVNNDGVTLLAGGGLTLLTLRWERGAAPSWALAAGAGLAVLFKATNILVVGMCALYLLLRPRNQEDTPPGQRSPRAGAAILLVAGAATVLSWMVVHGAISPEVVTPMERELAASALSISDVFARSLSLVTPISFGLPTEVLGGIPFATFGAILGLVMAVGSLAPLLAGSLAQRRDRISAAVGLSMLAGGTLFALTNHFVFGLNTDISPRYGFTLIPALAVAAAVAIRWRWALWGLGALAVGQVAVVLGGLVAA